MCSGRTTVCFFSLYHAALVVSLNPWTVRELHLAFNTPQLSQLLSSMLELDCPSLKRGKRIDTKVQVNTILLLYLQ